jgi:hypothetical protein
MDQSVTFENVLWSSYGDTDRFIEAENEFVVGNVPELTFIGRTTSPSGMYARRVSGLSLRAFSTLTKRIKIKSLLTQQTFLLQSQETIRIKGWVRSVRKQKKFAFLDIYDGSCLQGLQAIITDEFSDAFQRISL